MPGRVTVNGAAVLTLRPRTISHWMGLGLAVSVWVGLVRFAVVAAYWPHSAVLLWYFVLGALNTMVAGAVTGAVIGAIVRRSHRTQRDAEARRAARGVASVREGTQRCPALPLGHDPRP
jgi:hypothetical protein